MSKITILLDHPRRDLLFSVLIQRHIGPRAVIDLQDGYFTPDGPNFFSRSRHESVILTPSFHVKRTRFLSLRKSFSKSKLVILHSEQFIPENIYNEKLNLSFLDEYNKIVDFHFVWGEYYKEILVRNGIPAEKIKIVGYPKFDILDIIKNRFQIESNRCILFISNFNYADFDPEGWEIFKREFSYREDFDDNKYYKTARCEFIKTVKRASLDYPNSQIILRLHPGEARSSYSMLEGVQNIEISSANNLVVDLMRSFVVFQFDSSVIFESIYLGIPTFAVKFVEMPEKSMQPPAGSFIWYKIDQVKLLIDAPHKYESSINKQNMEYYFSNNTNRCLKIAGLLCELDSSENCRQFSSLFTTVGLEMIFKTCYCYVFTKTIFKKFVFFNKKILNSYQCWLDGEHAVLNADIQNVDEILTEKK